MSFTIDPNEIQRRFAVDGFVPVPADEVGAVVARRRAEGRCTCCGHTAADHDTNDTSCERCACQEFTRQ